MKSEWDLRATSENAISPSTRVQILAMEHSSLLATRSLTWNEIFSRAGMFLTLLSAAIVALALVAQASSFGPQLPQFALLLLPVVLFVGIVTSERLKHANIEDAGLVLGMNRLRHAYLEIAPELEPYFITEHHDDIAGFQQSYGLGYRFGLVSLLSGTAELVGIISALLSGVIAALIANQLGMTEPGIIAIGVITTVAAGVLFALRTRQVYNSSQREYHPRFARSSSE